MKLAALRNRVARLHRDTAGLVEERRDADARRMLGALSDDELREEIAAAGGWIDMEPRALERELGNRSDAERAAVIFEGRPELRARCAARLRT